MVGVIVLSGSIELVQIQFNKPGRPLRALTFAGPILHARYMLRTTADIRRRF